MNKVIVCLLLLGFAVAHAAPIRFDYVFEDSNTGASATGYIVFEESLLVNPTGSNLAGGGGSDGTYAIPGPEILDLAMTVTGSATSNGVYGLSDFNQAYFYTNGATLNLNAQLVGQPTDGSPWGTEIGGSAGDFNLFASNNGDAFSSYEAVNGVGGTIPSGCIHFTLCTSGDSMILVSMQGTPVVAAPVPAASTWSILLLTLSSLLFGFIYFRKQ